MVASSMITTSSAGAVENRSYLDGTANHWPHSSAETLHEAWRFGEIESTRSRTTNRQRSRCRARCRDCRLGCRSTAPRSGPFRNGTISRFVGRSRHRRHPRGARRGSAIHLRSRGRSTGASKASSCCWARCSASNYLRLTGAYRFRHFSKIFGATIGRALLAWLLSAGDAVRRRLLLRSHHRHQMAPGLPCGSPWARHVARGPSRITLNHQVKNWQRAGRLGELVAVIGSGPMAQRLLRGLNSASGGPRILGAYDDDAASLPRRCMGPRHPGVGRRSGA